MNNLGYLYDELKNYNEAIKYYKMAIKENDLDAIKNLGYLYHHKLKDDINASLYYTAMIGKKYPKEKIINFLKKRWNLSEETIKKGYEAQLNSTIIPEKLKYKGGI